MTVTGIDAGIHAAMFGADIILHDRPPFIGRILADALPVMMAPTFSTAALCGSSTERNDRRRRIGVPQQTANQRQARPARS